VFESVDVEHVFPFFFFFTINLSILFDPSAGSSL
jgi:hypothetical protein